MGAVKGGTQVKVAVRLLRGSGILCIMADKASQVGAEGSANKKQSSNVRKPMGSMSAWDCCCC